MVASKESLVHMREQAAASHKAIDIRLLYVKAVLAAEPQQDDVAFSFTTAKTYMTIKTHVDDQWKPAGPLDTLAFSTDWNVLNEQVEAGVKFPKEMWETVFIRAAYAASMSGVKIVQRNMWIHNLPNEILVHATAALVAKRFRDDPDITSSIAMFDELMDMFRPNQQYVMRIAAIMTTAACGGDSSLLDALLCGGTWPEGQLGLVKQAAATATTMWGQAGFTLPRRAAAEHLLSGIHFSK